MLVVCEMVFAENFLTCITFHWQEIHLPAEGFRTMLPKIRELHFDLLDRRYSSDYTGFEL